MYQKEIFPGLFKFASMLFFKYFSSEMSKKIVLAILRFESILFKMFKKVDKRKIVLGLLDLGVCFFKYLKKG